MNPVVVAAQLGLDGVVDETRSSFLGAEHLPIS